MPKISQQIIADALGISKATVSRCFSNHPGINPDTRARVFRKASELGYKPMLPRTGSARELVSTKIAMVACVPAGQFGTAEFDDPGSEVLAGLSEIALINNFAIETHFIDPLQVDPGRAFLQLLDSIEGEPWNGLLMVYPFPRESLLMIGNRIPTVSVLEQYGNQVPIDCVDADSHRGIALMVDRLVEAGHQRIGFYSDAYPVDPPWVLRRFSAYAERMAFHNLRFDFGDIFNVFPDSKVDTQQAIPKVLQRVDEGMTALVCAADHQAYPIIRAMEDVGKSVPNDLSITGFDGIPVPNGMPELSSVRVPYKEIGITAMQRLVTIIKQRSFATRHVQVECFECPGSTIGQIR